MGFPEKPEAVHKIIMSRNFLVLLAFIVLSIVVVGLFSFLTNPSQTVGYSLSFIGGLSMIFLPCTLPLAFVIVPIAMKESARKGLLMALMFAIGMIITFSVYGVAFSYIGNIIGLLTANVIAGIVGGLMAYLFGMSELGLIKIKIPGYGGPLPSFLNTMKNDYFKVFALGLVLANVGVGCPNPVFYVLLTYVISAGDVLTGWAMMAIHGIGRALPLIFLAILAILGTNATSMIAAKSENIRKWTAWGLIIVGIILFITTGLFRGWFEESSFHEFWNEFIMSISGGTIGEQKEINGETSPILEFVPQYIAPYVILVMLVVPLILHFTKRKEPKSF